MTRASEPTPLARIVPQKRAVPAEAGLVAGRRTRLAGEKAEAKVPGLGLPILIGAVLILTGFGGFVAWASTARLASASMAPGVVAVENKRRTVEHLEGGIVADLRVREGDVVEAGEVLVVIDQTQNAARREQLDSRLIALTAERDRLRALLDGKDEIAFSERLLARADEPEVAEQLSLQRRMHTEKGTEIDQTARIADSAIAEAREEIRGIDAQLEARRTGLAFLEERAVGLEDLASRGYATPVQLNAVKAEVASAKADIRQLEAARVAAEERIAQRTAEREKVETNTAVYAAERLPAVERELNEVIESLAAADDVVRRSDVVAPIAGRVVGLAVTTEGAVVEPGETLMEIVPADDRLVVDAMIKPEDIDVVHPGLPVDVRLTAYSFRTTPPVSGRLTQVSADRIVDGRTGVAIYRGVVELDPESLAALDGVDLYPGMPAEVMIKTGERTLMAYLFDPLMSAMNRALLEP